MSANMLLALNLPYWEIWVPLLVGMGCALLFVSGPRAAVAQETKTVRGEVTAMPGTGAGQATIVRCERCGTKNRVPFETP